MISSVRWAACNFLRWVAKLSRPITGDERPAAPSPSTRAAPADQAAERQLLLLRLDALLSLRWMGRLCWARSVTVTQRLAAGIAAVRSPRFHAHVIPLLAALIQGCNSSSGHSPSAHQHRHHHGHLHHRREAGARTRTPLRCVRLTPGPRRVPHVPQRFRRRAASVPLRTARDDRCGS